MPRGTALVVRFSSLGDVLLAAHMPSFLREAEPGRRVLFMTKERFAGILRGHPDVDRFYALADGTSDPAAPAPLGVRAGLVDLLAFLRREEIADLFDLHGSLRSSRVAGAFDRARRTIAPKHGLRRRLMVHAKWMRAAPLPPLLSVYRSLAGLDPGGGPSPWLRDALTDPERRRARAALGSDAGRFVLMGVGARWETKRWPARHFVALADALQRAHGVATRFAIGPGEAALAAEFRTLLGPERHGALLVGAFRDVAAIAVHAAAIVSNDSAVLHLGPALGVPALGIFGSTTPAFGFAPQGPDDSVVEIPLPCRPCDVHGKRRCPLGHHGCLERLTPDLALEALGRLLGPARSEAPAAERGSG